MAAKTGPSISTSDPLPPQTSRLENLSPPDEAAAKLGVTRSEIVEAVGVAASIKVDAGLAVHKGNDRGGPDNGITLDVNHPRTLSEARVHAPELTEFSLRWLEPDEDVVRTCAVAPA